MTFQDIVQLVGLVGVLASLIYVAIQIRNSARAVRAATYYNISQAISSPWFEMANNPELCGLMLRGTDDFSALDRLEKARFRFLMQTFMNRYETAWFQYKVRALKEEDWQAIAANVRSVYKTPRA